MYRFNLTINTLTRDGLYIFILVVFVLAGCQTKYTTEIGGRALESIVDTTLSGQPYLDIQNSPRFERQILSHIFLPDSTTLYQDTLGMWVVFDQTLFQDIANYHDLIYQVSYRVESNGKYPIPDYILDSRDSVYIKIPTKRINREAEEITFYNQFHWETASGLSCDTLFVYGIPNPLYVQGLIQGE